MFEFQQEQARFNKVRLATKTNEDIRLNQKMYY